jgi:hypothetical protein
VFPGGNTSLTGPRVRVLRGLRVRAPGGASWEAELVTREPSPEKRGATHESTERQREEGSKDRMLFVLMVGIGTVGLLVLATDLVRHLVTGDRWPTDERPVAIGGLLVAGAFILFWRRLAGE